MAHRRACWWMQRRNSCSAWCPRPRPGERDIALAKAQQLLHAYGITAVADMGTTIEDWQAMRRAGDAGWLSLRIMAYAAGMEQAELIAGAGSIPVALR